MDSWLSISIFALFLFVVFAYKYRLPGLLSCAFLIVGCGSIYSIFLFAGLTPNKSTLFGILALLFFSLSNSLNLFSWMKKYLKANNYTTRMAMYLANKKHNIYLYELALMLLIPAALLIFLLPTKLKEMGIVLGLGSVFMLTVWFLFSNFYLPKLSYLGEQKPYLLVSNSLYWADKKRETHSLWHLIREIQAEGKQSTVKEEIKKKKAELASLDFAPVIFLLGFIGLILWLSNCELNYPQFFKNNKLLSVDSSAKSQLSNSLKGLNGSYKELKSIPDSLKSKNTGVSNGWLFYLFPENLNIETITQALSGKNGEKTSGIGNTKWTIQNTDSFSVMPSLEKSVGLVFLSLAPVSCYSLFRFGFANASSLIISSLLFLGTGFLFLLSGKFMQVPELLPEIILSAFFVLLSFWVKLIVNSREVSKLIADEQQNKKSQFWLQSRKIRAELKRDNGFYFLAFISMLVLALTSAKLELLTAFSYFLFLVLVICLFFIPPLTLLWFNLNLLVDKYYYHLVGFFVREKKRIREVRVEEENVLGINY
ncbi:hypothetical protein DNK47_00680 [Mycoplasma wenyonii]|uniref:Uncharacterized protein n=1 Tax=Mycoplasma wenyonii TaxID=65123 RepID=A0A328PU99_9MOLU|nr:hypothetical protein [Mycoplasma wenyonii]RAO95350.1 hypothetical protein DNK47_00680 [Mycoplasma wenyonii]